MSERDTSHAAAQELERKLEDANSEVQGQRRYQEEAERKMHELEEVDACISAPICTRLGAHGQLQTREEPVVK